MERKFKSIGLSGFGGFLNIIIGLSTLSGMGLLASGTRLWILIRITFIPFGIIAVIGALVENKRLIIGSCLCLLAGMLTIVLILIIDYPVFYVTMAFMPYIYIPTFLIIVGGILGISIPKSSKGPTPSKKKIIDYQKRRRIIFYSLIAVSLPILIFLSYYILYVIVVGSAGLNIWLWLITFLLSLICFVFGIYKSIRERRTKES